AITAVSGLIVLLFWRKTEPVSLPIKLFILFSFLVATLMMTPLSRLLWDYLPLLSFTQFPWRFLSVQAFAGALAVAGLALLPGRQWWVPLLSGVLMLAALGNLQTDHLLLTDADVTARKLAEYEWYTGNIGSTVSAEYLPPTVQPRPVTSPWLNAGSRDHVTILAGAADVALIERKSSQQSWLVQAAEETSLVFPTLAWPGWQVLVDGDVVDSQSAAGSGLIQVTVPSGEHVVDLRLTRTPVRLGAELVSLTAVFMLIVLLRPRRWQLPGRKWIVLLAALLLVSAIAILWPEHKLPDSDLNWDFAQMAYLHHEADCVPFTGSLCLEAYHYSDNTLQAGETLMIETAWSGSGLIEASAATVALYSPAITRPPIVANVEPAAFAADSAGLAEALSFSLVLPDDIPPGLYVPRLVVTGHQPVTSSGQTRGELFLRPVQVLSEGVAAAEPRGELDVAVLAAALRESEPTLDLHLVWFTAQPLTQNYNISLRLTDANGQWLRQLDTQPGFGFLPSSGWTTGQWTPDWLALSLPELDAAAGSYPLVMQVYEVASPEVPVLTRRLGAVEQVAGAWVFQANEPLFELPEGIVAETAVSAVFGDEIQLLGYELVQDDATATITLYWQAVSNGRTDYTRFVQLLGSEPGQPPLAQVDSYPVFNNYPTSQWSAGEIVADEVVLNLTDVPAGEYPLLVGFYDGNLERVTAVAGDGSLLPDNVLPFTRLKIGD
ncbi:MAG: hypothetical protein IAF02_12165, partial [Anaerolineae bacterium]|nr:hypothetical protein [Anaerolineae bacterium]